MYTTNRPETVTQTDTPMIPKHMPSSRPSDTHTRYPALMLVCVLYVSTVWYFCWVWQYVAAAIVLIEPTCDICFCYVLSLLLSQVLSDEALRANYDASGKDSVETAPKVDPSTLFAMIFGSEKFVPLVGTIVVSARLLYLCTVCGVVHAFIAKYHGSAIGWRLGDGQLPVCVYLYCVVLFLLCTVQT